jgi:predicted dehydrogenase
MARDAARNGLLLMPSFAHRFDPWFAAAHDHLAAGTIGDIRQMRCDWSFPVGGWFAARHGGDPDGQDWNALMPQMACQTMDTCLHWLGPASTVSADIDEPQVGIAKVRGAPPPTLANIIVSHDQSQSTHHLSRARSIHPGERYVAAGSTGHLELVVSVGESSPSATAPSLRLHRPGQKPEELTVSTDARTAGPEPGMQGLLTHFADCVRLGIRPLVSSADARAAHEIVRAAEISSADHVKVQLPLHG